MSFSECKDVISEGDTMILYLGHDHVVAQAATRNYTYQTKYGALRHNDLIGARYGSRVKTSKGFIHVLHPTPELWTLCLPHRTQILYTTDISFIIYQLELKPGSVVCEAGTGSASMSHAILRTIRPHGHLYTYDFHEDRVKLADMEFKCHGLGDCATVTLRDVCNDGFPLEDVADAVFLDLPSPWAVIESAHRALKSTGRLCSFSPCIEQVSKVVEAMTGMGMCDVTTAECLSRQYDVKLTTLQLPQLTSTTTRPLTHHTISDTSMVEVSDISDTPVEVSNTTDTPVEVSNTTDTTVEVSDTTDTPVEVSNTTGTTVEVSNTTDTPVEVSDTSATPAPVLDCKKRMREVTLHTCTSPVEQPGHTGYLTFATKY